MNLKNCIECGNIMVENPSGLCPNCIRDEEEAEDKVAEFLRDTRRASAEEIAKGTGVKLKIILRMLKRGRITSDAQISYPCETCGAQIAEGRVCDQCAKGINDQIKKEPWQAPKQAEAPKKDERMYIKDLLNRK